MEYKEMFIPSLIQLAVDVKNKEEAFLIAAQRLEKMGYVNENYLNGLIAREREFPTGLITKYLNIALPHSECEYVEKPFVFVMQLKNPIYFYQMGDNQEMTVENLYSWMKHSWKIIRNKKHRQKYTNLLQIIFRRKKNEESVNCRMWKWRSNESDDRE